MFLPSLYVSLPTILDINQAKQRKQQSKTQSASPDNPVLQSDPHFDATTAFLSELHEQDLAENDILQDHLDDPETDGLPPFNDNLKSDDEEEADPVDAEVTKILEVNDIGAQSDYFSEGDDGSHTRVHPSLTVDKMIENSLATS